MKKIAMCAAFGLFAALAAGPAQAGTTHTTGGEACQSVYDTSYTYGKYIFYGNGVHAYDTAAAKFFSCPIPWTGMVTVVAPKLSERSSRKWPTSSREPRGH